MSNMEAIALEWSNKDRNMCNRYQLGAKAALLDNMYDLALGVGGGRRKIWSIFHKYKGTFGLMQGVGWSLGPKNGKIPKVPSNFAKAYIQKYPPLGQHYHRRRPFEINQFFIQISLTFCQKVGKLFYLKHKPQEFLWVPIKLE